MLCEMIYDFVHIMYVLSRDMNVKLLLKIRSLRSLIETLTFIVKDIDCSCVLS